jgi:transposase
LDKNQIPGIKNVNIERFEILNSENMIEQIKRMMFVKYDDKTFYQNLGIVDGRRYILIFNPKMYIDENNSREKLIIRAKAYLEEESKALSNAEKSRNESTTRNRIEKELKTMKADKFIEYDLEPLVINKEGKEVNSFRISPKETFATKEAIRKAKRTDGLWIIVTNNTGENKEGIKLTEEDLISAYRDKNQIEQAFRDVKSFIKIQPFNVWEPKHVRAHYTICVLSYLLNITVTNRLRKANIDVKSSKKTYEILRDGIVGKMSLKSTGEESLNLMQLQLQQEKILELFQCEGIVEKNYLKSIGVVNCSGLKALSVRGCLG